MTVAPHILLAEDDREICELASRFLTDNNMRVTVTGNGRDVRRLLTRNNIDLVVLGTTLRGEDGLSICRHLRSGSSNIPIIVLTAKNEDEDRISGLEIGADDCMTKPLSPRELLARIRAILRRSNAGMEDGDSASVLIFGGWRFDLNKRELQGKDGARVILTGAESNLLRVFCEKSSTTLSRDQLLDLTQGRTTNLCERTVDILVSRLRRKIEGNSKEPELIQTIRSAGYRFSGKVVRE